jgi:tetratricopeptide (TPR) repeat protein
MSAQDQELVFGRARENKFAKWPSATPERLRPWCAPAVAPKFVIGNDEVVFTIGSCFARNIEEHLSRLGMNVPVMQFSVPRTEYEGRPNGIINKYTPPAILNELRFALEEPPPLALDDHFLEAPESRVVDLHLNSYRPVALERARERRRQVRELFRNADNSTVIILTLGLTEAWYDKKNGIYINDAPAPRLAHNFPGRFVFKVLTYKECLDAVRDAIELINRSAIPKKIVLTVSPVPLGRTFTEDDAIVANAHSKATLRAVAGVIAAEFANVQYFPSYEIATLSAPDQVWSGDQIHLRDDAVGRIVETFIATFCQAPDHREHFAARLVMSGGDAENGYRRLKSLDSPGQGQTYLADLAEACDKTSRRTEAVETAQRLVRLRPERGGNWHLLAQMAVKDERYDVALDAIDHAIAIEPEVSRYHADRGFILDRLGCAVAAASEAEMAARLVDRTDPDQQIPRQRLATRALELMVKANLIERAAAFFTEFCTFITDYPPLLRVGARIFAQTGDLERAVAYARREAELAPDFVVYRHYGVLCLRAQHYDEALAALARALELQPNHQPTTLQFFAALEGCGRGDEVLRLAAERRVAASLSPDIERWLVNFSWRHAQRTAAAKPPPAPARLLAQASP